MADSILPKKGRAMAGASRLGRLATRGLRTIEEHCIPIRLGKSIAQRYQLRYYPLTPSLPRRTASGTLDRGRTPGKCTTATTTSIPTITHISLKPDTDWVPAETPVN